MSINDRAKATGKNIEGKIQEAVGKVTGNPQDEVAGRAKQQEASAEHTVENIKDNLKKAVDGL
ncbi:MULTISPECIES: CsbD family protein [unclassified Leptolyngbya]|uniref:CsbD family protein n=1 Tax=unclassified Leptolyngbya TaxID=2650499 RepID=UPI001689BF97|nr:MULTISPECIES: CsbD family protein [unclassified Leptolyngbya]MBD1913979.1 CsbD family protein [Leptolyngbya sp. FACHB-8]MBD2155946.1 CsbD family protein [Leptolyngbya sp. FACHB-16]